MNPDQPLDPREELEIKITALVMGQLSPEEAVALEAKIAADPQLASLQARLRHAANLLKQARALPDAPAPTAPLQFSKERREKLLATFRGTKPLPSPAAPSTSAPIQASRPKRKWTQPLILAASIAVLLTGAAVLFMPAMSSFAPRREASKALRDERRYAAEAADISPMPLITRDRVSGMSDPKIYNPASPPEVKLTLNAPSRSSSWASQPGAIRTLDEQAGEARRHRQAANIGSGQESPKVYLPSSPKEGLAGSTPAISSFETELNRDGAEAGGRRDSGGREDTEKLLAEAEKQRGLGRFEMAGRKYEEALAKDPNNIAARKGRQDIFQRKAQVADQAYSAARSPAMSEVTSLWDREYQRFPRAGIEMPKEEGQKQSGIPDPALVWRENKADKNGQEPVSSAGGAIGESLSVQQAETRPLIKQVGDTTLIADQRNNTITMVGGKETQDRISVLLDQLDVASPRTERQLAEPVVPPDLEEALGETSRANIQTAGENTYWDKEGAGVGERSKSQKGGEARELDLKTVSKGPADAPAGPSAAEDHLARLYLMPNPQAAPDQPNSVMLGVDALPADAFKLDGFANFDALSPEFSAPIDTGVAAQTAPLAESAGAAAPAQPGKPASGSGVVDPAQEKFVSAFLAARKADEQAMAGERQKSLATYRSAADTLAKIKEQWPNWQPELLEYRLKRTKDQIGKLQEELGQTTATEQAAPKEAAEKPASPAPAAEPDAPVKAKEPPPVPQPEVSTKENAFSTFSLNVSDVSFQLAAASLDKGQMPEPATIRSEEFINAFDYRDPEPAQGTPLAFASERARDPFAHNRDLLRLSVKTAAAGREAGRPLNLVLLLDNSGSMERADRVRILQESLRVLVKQLQPQDKLSIITFSRTPRLWVDGVAGDEAAEYTQRVSEITPQGGTDLSAAMDLGYQTALKHHQAGSINRVVLLTDGAANLGEVKPETLKEKVEAHRKQGVAFDCFGIGWEGYNDDLLEQLSRNGDGRYGFINTPEAAATEFAGQLAGALRVAASDVKVQVEFNPKRVLAYRQIGYAKHQLKKEQFRDNAVDAAEIGAAEAGNALYAIEVDPRGEGDIGIARARFKAPGTMEYHEREWTVPYGAPAPAMEQASSSLRLAATAAAFSEWLAQSPFATEVTTDRLLGLIRGVPAIYGADPRPAKLEAMIRQAKSISGR